MSDLGGIVQPTLELIEAWARSKAPDAKLGLAGQCSLCPVANFTREMNAGRVADVEVNDDGINYGFASGDTSHVPWGADDPVAVLVGEIDGHHYPGGGDAVTSAVLLGEILPRVRSWFGEEGGQA